MVVYNVYVVHTMCICSAIQCVYVVHTHYRLEGGPNIVTECKIVKGSDLVKLVDAGYRKWRINCNECDEMCM